MSTKDKKKITFIDTLGTALLDGLEDLEDFLFSDLKNREKMPWEKKEEKKKGGFFEK